MYIMYCLTNASFKETILSVGMTPSIASLHQLLADMNTAILPTPYTILTTKQVCNENSIDNVYALLTKFGSYLQGTFFEIAPETIQQIFDLVDDMPRVHMQCDHMPRDHMPCDYDASEHTNVILQEKYRVMQSEVEYIIPKAVDGLYEEIIYQVPPPAKAAAVYDRLSFKQKKYVNLDDVEL
jgi:hypothetical protein